LATRAKCSAKFVKGQSSIDIHFDDKVTPEGKVWKIIGFGVSDPLEEGDPPIITDEQWQAVSVHEQSDFASRE
jgi:hypothetical protein